LKKPPVIDLHEDISYYYMGRGFNQPFGEFDKDLEGRQADIPKYVRGNVRIVFASIFPQVDVYGGAGWKGLYGGKPITSLVEASPASSRLILLDHIKTYYRLARSYGITIVERRSDANHLVSGGEWRLGFVLHLEGADPLADAGDLELLWRLGVRSVGLTWNNDNKWAAGAGTRKDYGLTAEGEELVREANRLGIIVDIAHASPRAAEEIINISKKPVMASHTGLTSWVKTPRNITPEVLEALASKGGVMGVTLITPIIFGPGEEATIEALARKIAGLVEVYGSKVVALGTDFHGLLDLKPPRGFESIDRVARLLEILGELGLSDSQIEDIAYRNALRVINENLEG